MNFSQAEMVDMIFVLGASDKNTLLARRLYQQRFPERRQPERRAFEKLLERFERTGNVLYKKNTREKRAQTEENQLDVLLTVTENPYIGQRPISQQIGVKRCTVQRILKSQKMHPYHIQLLQELIPEDYQRRLEFCQWVQNKIIQQRNFVHSILFTDEATFHRNGSVNRHNFHYYSTENPNFVRYTSQTRWSLNVWGGVVGDHVIGPYFFDQRVTGEVYLYFLQNHLPNLLRQVPHETQQEMWFLHDGAPVHHTCPIITFLNARYPDCWIGRGGPVAWPARSPDLTKMDFSIWGYVKDQVYKIPPTTKEDMKIRIRNCFQNISVEMCRNLSNEFEKRIALCIQERGGHFEQLIR
jgi:Helix-turn-helix domain (DUF4817)